MKFASPKLLLAVCFLYTNICTAAVIDTVETYSPSMHKKIKAVVIKPNSYGVIKQIPVVYLLHGYSDNYAGWITKVKGVEILADLYNVLIVCPDGGYGSWYWDSPVDSSYKYETYVSNELIKWIDSHYKTIANKKGRAITGLSMGGHGALYLAIKHPDIFGAAGSMSGGVDIRPFPNNWDISKRLGIYAGNQQHWEQNTVINMLHLIQPNTLQLIIDCGIDDFFFKVNENFHQQLAYRNIPHDYITRPGAHSWPYWANAVKYQLLFMSNFFKRG
jgi:S-formylglutathione hydrolase FrmB